MQFRIYVALAVFSIGLMGCGPRNQPEVDLPIRTLPQSTAPRSFAEELYMPPFELPDVEGNLVSSASFEGDVLLVNFWATWCGPCIEEMPELSELHKEYADQGFSVIGISLDVDGPEVVKPFLEAYPVSYPVLLDDNTVADQFGGVWGLPVSFLVDREGNIVRRFIGIFPFEATQPMLQALLKASRTN